MFRVHVEVVLIDGEWLGALSDERHKLLHLQESGPVAFEGPDGDVGGSDAVCGTGNERSHWVPGSRRGVTKYTTERDFGNIWRGGLLVTSGATLSIVTSKFPNSTGSLAIFSGLWGGNGGEKKNV